MRCNGLLGCFVASLALACSTCGGDAAKGDANCAQVPTSVLRPEILGGGGVAVGSAPACGPFEGDPGVARLRVEAVNINRHESVVNGHTTYVTILKTVRTDQPDPCGLQLSVVLVDQVLDVSPGTEISWLHRADIRNPELDVSVTSTLRGKSGQLILAVVLETRPAVWRPQDLDGLSISIDPPVCRSSDGNGLAVGHLKTAGEDCAVRNETQATCNLWGRPHAVWMLQAQHGPAKKSEFGHASTETMSFTIMDPKYRRLGPPQ